MLPVSTFANTVADAVARRVGGGTVGAGEGVCDLGGFIVGDYQGLGCESALSSECVSLRIVEEWSGGSTYISALCWCLLAISE